MCFSRHRSFSEIKHRLGLTSRGILKKLAAKERGINRKASSVSFVTLSASDIARLLSRSDIVVLRDSLVYPIVDRVI